MIPLSAIQRDKHEAILDAAYALFGSNGFYETKMSDIAELTGIAKGTVYLYFKSKEELFTAVTHRDCERFKQDLQAGLNQCDEIADKLYCIAAHHLSYYYDCRQYQKLFFMAPNNNKELNACLKQFMEDYMRMVVRVLEENRVTDSVLYAQTFIGMLDRLKMDILYLQDFSREDLDQRIQFAANLFIHGFMSQTSESAGR